MPVRCNGRKYLKHSIVQHLLYPILANVKNKITLSIAFWTIKFRREEAILTAFAKTEDLL